MDSQYSNFEYDIEAEQQKLVAADIIVLQFPFYWHSMPALMQRWMEQVFQHGFSHGSTGDALKSKTLVASFTTGAPDFAYAYDGMMKFPLEDYLAPMKSTCILTQMNFGGFIATSGVSYSDRKPENEAATRAKLEDHTGLIIAQAQNYDALDAILKEDVYYPIGGASYETTEFKAVMIADNIKQYQA